MASATGRKLYPAVIEKRNTAFGVFFPDLPGCVSAGDTIAETVTNAHEALALHILGMTEAGELIPGPTPLGDLVPEPPEIAVVAVLLVGVMLPSSRAAKVDIVIDEALLHEIDAVSDDRSRFLSDAARVELARRMAG